jgi:hypothetical protein
MTVMITRKKSSEMSDKMLKILMLTAVLSLFFPVGSFISDCVILGKFMSAV